MKHIIKVDGIQCYAHHGCLNEEALIGGRYVVNVSIVTDFTAAAEEDDLSKTVDYCDVARIVQEEMAIRSKLIEQVGHRMVTRLQSELEGIHELTLEIIKLSPPIQGEVKQVSVVFSTSGTQLL
jgi:7,8-dihydroneopterin aldolase/epimerase/oxygenase